ncbi:MAG: hypothetical protein KDD25_03110 [Bdellovibrionales bacterium]|nr:hypothetical protein [Bdellovibrionales bacterium]
MRYAKLLFIGVFFVSSAGYPQAPAPKSDEATQPESAETTENARSFFVFPLAVSLLGVGSFYGLTAGVNKLTGTDIDITLAKTFGRIDAHGGLITGIPVVPSKLYIDVSYGRINEGFFETEYARGIEKADVYVEKIEAYGLRFELKYYPFEWWTIRPGFAQTEAEINEYTYNGNEVDLNDTDIASINTDYIFTETDITLLDNKERPTKGAIATLGALYESGRAEESDQLTLSYKVSGYVPVATSLVWANTIFGSDATVLNEKYGEPSDIRSKLGSNCSDISNQSHRDRCEDWQDDYVHYQSASNRNGSAYALGGSRYLRSYREGRFRGAHSRAFSSELRWTLSETLGIPYFTNSGRAIDLVPFWDVGFVNDFESKLYDSARNSFGASLRAYFSPTVIRLAYATGEEGDGIYLTAGAAW